MKTFGYLVLALVVLLAFPARSTMAGAEVYRSNEKIPFEDRFWLFCADGGRGEFVRLSGEMHALFLVTFDASGGHHLSSRFQPMGIAGYGESTGDRYRASGITREGWNFQPEAYPVVYTAVNSFLITGPGTGNNILVHDTYHVTVNANGEVTAYIVNAWGECR